MSGLATGHLKSLLAGNIRSAMGDMTSADLALRLQTHERNVRRWRNGESTPGLNRLTEIAQILGQPVEWFYTDHATEADGEAA